MRLFVRPWKISAKLVLVQLLAGEILLLLINLLCYSDWRWMGPLQLLMIPFFLECGRYREKHLRRQYKQGFSDLLQSLMSSVQAGYTMENACRAACHEMQADSFRGNDPTIKQLQRINHGMDLGGSLDQLFKNYARTAGIRDIMQFAQVIEIVKTTGGNLMMILKNTRNNFQVKMDTEEEIRVILSGVIYEKNLMLVMPLLVFAYMRLTNGEYMSCLYESTAGHILMSVVLAAITGCYYWTESMIRIES